MLSGCMGNSIYQERRLSLGVRAQSAQMVAGIRIVERFKVSCLKRWEPLSDSKTGVDKLQPMGQVWLAASSCMTMAIHILAVSGFSLALQG